MSMYTDGQYMANNPTWHEEHADWKAAYIARMLQRNRVAPRSVAEIGCGTGRVILELGNKLPAAERLDGFEISPQAFERARTLGTDRVRYSNVDVLKTPPAERFDLAMAIDVFEHVDDYLGFIKSVSQLADYKVFHIPLELSVSSMLRPSALERARADVGHIHYFTRETALAALRATGLEIIDEHFTSVSIDHATALKTRALRLPRRLMFGLAPNFAARLFGGFSLLVLAR